MQLDGLFLAGDSFLDPAQLLQTEGSVGQCSDRRPPAQLPIAELECSLRSQLE